MPGSAANSIKPELRREILPADAIEFAEYAGDDPAENESSLPPSSVQTADQLSAPAWFRKRPAQPKSVHIPAEPQTVIGSTNVEKTAAANASEPKRSPPRQPRSVASRKLTRQHSFVSHFNSMRQLIRRAVVGACGTSLLLHAVIFLLLSLIFFQDALPPEAFSTLFSEVTGVPEAFDGVVELAMPKADAELSRAPELVAIPFDEPRLAYATDVIANATQSTGQDVGGDQFGDSDGFQFRMPTGGKAVKKGSFAAWTVPADPKPREDYVIVIRIKLPAGLKTYRVADISGDVIGTDGFLLKVPFDQRRSEATKTERAGKVVAVKPTDLLRIVDGHAQIMVSIPGAAALVKDTIQLKSRLLKEEQKLEIEF